MVIKDIAYKHRSFMEARQHFLKGSSSLGFQKQEDCVRAIN